MRNFITLIFAMAIHSSLSAITTSDKNPENFLHPDDTIPFYTPFVSMYTVDSNWMVAFSMINIKDDILTIEKATDSTCLSLKCALWWKINIYPKGTPQNQMAGKDLNKWLRSRQSHLIRSKIDYPISEAVELTTFLIKFSDLGRGNVSRYEESGLKILIGEHPEKKINKEKGIVTHQDGAIHYPTGGI